MDESQKLAVRLVGMEDAAPIKVSKDRLVAACLEPGASLSKLAREHQINAKLSVPSDPRQSRERTVSSPAAMAVEGIYPA